MRACVCVRARACRMAVFYRRLVEHSIHMACLLFKGTKLSRDLYHISCLLNQAEVQLPAETDCFHLADILTRVLIRGDVIRSEPITRIRWTSK